MAGARLGAAIRDLGGLIDEGSAAGLADEQLLARFVARRDGPAFEALVARHGPMVLATCRAVLRDAHEAEDAFQATFLILARKAGSLRSADSLGPWLHRVARRVSTGADAAIARRRRIEVAGKAAEFADPRPRSLDHVDDWPILHEEVDRLPERYRAPIVLCYLEGMTYEQAAGHLRWPVGTVGGRIARARELIRRRLLRRGIRAPLVPLVMSVPERMIRSALAAASAGSASPGSRLLADLVARGMLLSRLRLASAFLVAMVALTPAVGGRFVAVPAAPGPAPALVAPQVPAAAPPLAETVRVVDPDDRPVAGARVYRSDVRFRSFGHDPFAAVLLARTGPDGAFPLGPDLARAAANREETVLALAEGFGPAFVDATDKGRIRLARDDVPIRGRVLDIEGRPVAGATAQLVGILWPPGGTLDAWLAALATERLAYQVQYRQLRSWQSDDIPALYPAATTDASGRFTLRGVGRERVAMLLIAGPGIETRFEYAATRAMPAVRSPEFAQQGQARPGQQREITYHGAAFDLVAGPGLEVVGTVRDQDTGKPLAGIVVQSAAPFGNPLRCLKAITDAEGRFRLPGVAPKDKYGQDQGVVASAKDGPPYLSTAQPLGEGRGTVTRDLALKRGVWAQGRVVDKTTGRPVSAGVSYFIPEDNPHLKDYPPYGTVRISQPLEADEHGDFRLVVIPGRGVLAARTGDGIYRFGAGLDKLAGLTTRRLGLPTLPAQPTPLVPRNFNVVIEINPAEGDESVTVDLPLDRGRTVRGTLVGPGGEPVAGAVMLGADATERWSTVPLPAAEFEARSIGPVERRALIFMDEAKGLAGSSVVGPGEAGPLTVRLQSSGTWTGRLVDDDGRPLAGAAITTSRIVAGVVGDEARLEQGSLPGLTRADDAGRFRVAGLVPGLKYTLMVRKDRGIGFIVRDGIVAPGEVKDFGDVRALPPPRP